MGYSGIARVLGLKSPYWKAVRIYWSNTNFQDYDSNEAFPVIEKVKGSKVFNQPVEVVADNNFLEAIQKNVKYKHAAYIADAVSQWIVVEVEVYKGQWDKELGAFKKTGVVNLENGCWALNLEKIKRMGIRKLL